MHVRMERAFTYDVEDQPGVYRTLPAGWVGEVDDAIGQAAVDEGSAVDAKPKGDKAEEGGSGSEGLSAKTVSELKSITEAEEIDLGDATKKADIIAAIELGREDKATA